MASFCEENLTREEAEGFIRNILCEEIPTSLDLLWINKIIQAFHRRIPYQNVTLLSQRAEYRVPSWRDIYKDIIEDGKGGLCLSLNIALAAVLRAVGMRAYTAAADYVATRGRGVHVVVIIDLNSMTRLYSGRLRSSMSNTRRRHDAPEVDMHTSQTFPFKGRVSTHYEEGRLQTSPQKNKLETCLSHDNDSSHVTEGENGLYLADVGCGFPTLKAVNLKKDVGKVFMDCCLEYCLVKKGQQFIRMHRSGDCIPEGEEGNVNSEGWRPVFSFNLTPRDLSFFKRSMKPIYVDKETSPYFGELHAICYTNSHEMIAIKNEELIQSKAVEGSPENSFCNLRKVKSRVKLRQDELFEILYENFSMIPKTEVDIALQRFFNIK